MEDIKLYFDSNESLYDLKIEVSHKDDISIVEELKSVVLNLKYDEIINLNYNQFIGQEKYQRILLKLLNALYDFRSDTYFEDSISGNYQLICRCLALSSRELKESFYDVKGKRKEFFKNTNASMICGKCQDEVEALIEKFGVDFYEGKPLSFYQGQIEEMINEFPMFSPGDFQTADVSLHSLKPGKLRIRVKKNESKIKKSRAQEVLQEYLGRTISQLFEITIVLN